tara:strand:- start:4558 stop:4731 length:174 start_codon:yes stop_codon:yes gene_type:complete
MTPMQRLVERKARILGASPQTRQRAQLIAIERVQGGEPRIRAVRAAVSYAAQETDHG